MQSVSAQGRCSWLHVCSFTSIGCAGCTFELKESSGTEGLLLISPDPLRIPSRDVGALWLIKFALDEPIFLKAPNVRILENALGEDASKVPTEVLLFCCIVLIRFHSESVALTTVYM